MDFCIAGTFTDSIARLITDERNAAHWKQSVTN